MKRLVWLLALTLFDAQAASQSWSDSSIGPGLSQRGVAAASRPLNGDPQAQGSVTLVYWNYRLSGPMPAGLQVKLCADNRCVPLEGASGSTRGLSNLNANATLRFVYLVEGRGAVFPLTRVLSNQVAVNYQTP